MDDQSTQELSEILQSRVEDQTAEFERHLVNWVSHNFGQTGLLASDSAKIKYLAQKFIRQAMDTGRLETQAAQARDYIRNDNGRVVLQAVLAGKTLAQQE